MVHISKQIVLAALTVAPALAAPILQGNVEVKTRNLEDVMEMRELGSEKDVVDIALMSRDMLTALEDDILRRTVTPLGHRLKKPMTSPSRRPSILSRPRVKPIIKGSSRAGIDC